MLEVKPEGRAESLHSGQRRSVERTLEGRDLGWGEKWMVKGRTGGTN